MAHVVTLSIQFAHRAFVEVIETIHRIVTLL